jgi:hypothetical protein
MASLTSDGLRSPPSNHFAHRSKFGERGVGTKSNGSLISDLSVILDLSHASLLWAQVGEVGAVPLR